MSFFLRFSDLLSSAVPPLLLFVGLYFCLRLRFFPFLRPRLMLRELFRKEEGGREDSPRSHGRERGQGRREEAPSPFRAASVAMAGTIGVGNIAGVSLAILVGGPGAIFWMWVCAFAAMILKYAEITLAHDSRRPDGKGGYVGGTPFSMRQIGWRRTGALFSILCLIHCLTVGGMVQANVIADCLTDSFSVPPLLSGVLLLLLTLPVIFGGGRRISELTAKIVPGMCLLYLVAALAVILRFADRIPAVLGDILTSAFAPASGVGGALGFLSSRALRIGAARGLMSNEGGCGTAPMAHVATREEVAARQGLFGILEVFIDTIVICTLTALLLLLPFPSLPEGLGGVALVRLSLSSVWGVAAAPLLSLCVFFFAYATILCAAFYGESCLQYFDSKGGVCRVFPLFFCFFLVVGAVGAPALVWRVTDLLLAVMTISNLFLLLRQSDRIAELTAAAGYIPPVRGKRGPVGACRKRKGAGRVLGTRECAADQAVTEQRPPS